MKMTKAILVLASLGFSAASFAACPSSNSTMQTIERQQGDKKICAMRATNPENPMVISESITFTADTDYYVGNGLYIGDNKMRAEGDSKIALTIEAGTKILGQSKKAYVQVNRGAQIFANGTQEQPIVFTTAQTENRTRGSWGGLIINGSAPVNGCKDASQICQLKGEGLTQYQYGGANPNDNSGVLNYVVVEFAGNAITPDNELNGIAFQGVGKETKVDYIQVHMNDDDGVEFFGGNVDVKHVVLTGNKDDSLDWTNGWTGSAQFVIVEQYADAANNGIEADNYGKKHDASPRSFPTLSNMTFIGTSTEMGAKGGNGILLRRGTGAKIYNSYITGFSKSCFDMDDFETFANAEGEKGIFVENLYVNCETAFTPVEMIKEKDAEGNVISETPEPFAPENFVMAQAGNSIQSIALEGYAPVAKVAVEKNASGTDYIGAVQDASDRWFAGWIQTSKN